VGYVAVVGGLSLLLVYGAIWLAHPDPSLKAKLRATPLSPRIAESIERKKDTIPRDAPVKIRPAESMTEVNVALTPSPPPAPKPIPRETRHRAKIKHVPNPNVAPRQIARDGPAAAPRPVVATARSDAPY
jgi:hypothetical protein